MSEELEKIYNDPIRFMKRAGTNEDPYMEQTEVITVLDGVAQLREIPNKVDRVVVSGRNIYWVERVDGNFNDLADNEYKVDYVNGLVSFNSNHEGHSLTFKYLGEGVIYFPDSRVYLTDDEEFKVLSRKLKDLDRADLEQKNRVDTLIVENPQPSEVVDLRVDRNGIVYRVARDRINAEQKKIEDTYYGEDGREYTSMKHRFDTIDGMIEDTVDQLTDLINKNTGEFDISKLDAQFVTNLGNLRNAVNQSINFDVKTNQIYTTTSDSKTPEGFVITRLTPSGKYISSMTIPEGGHGTMIGVDRKTSSGKVKIWAYHTGLRKLIQFDYIDNGTLTVAQATALTDYTPSSLRSVYFTPYYDHYFDRMLIRRDDGICELRNRTEIINKVDNKLNSVQVDKNEMSDSRPMQGAVVYDKTLWWLSGTSAQDNQAKILEYNMTSGILEKTITLDKISTYSGVNEWRDNFKEPEGLSFYVDSTGRKSLLFVITNGGMEKRFHNLYAFTEENYSSHWSNISRLGGQNYALTRGDGRAFSIPDNTVKLSDIMQPGHYYMTTAVSSSLTDFPWKDGDGAGWWLDIKPANQQLAVRQVLTRNSTGRKLLILERVVNLDGSVGVWTIISTNSMTGEIVTASDFGNLISNITMPGEYYLTTPQSALFTDHPEKNAAGWWLKVSSGDANTSVHQELKRNSGERHHYYYRTVDYQAKTVTPWQAVRHGVKDYTDITSLGSNVTSHDMRVANDGDNLIIRGAFTISSYSEEMVICTLPNSWKPEFLWQVNVSSDVENGMEHENATLIFRSDGKVAFQRPSSGTVANRYVFNAIVPIY
ncbi:hypothetical protein NL868_001326 [Shigella flexneri]|nr:hypothetical protein [Shigella flexneri]